MKTKKIVCMMMVAVLSLGSVFSVFAADEKINTVKLSFSYDKAPESGDSIGTINVTAGGGNYSVDSADYTNSDDHDKWTVGDVPEVKIELSADDGYRFYYTTKSHFSLSGCNAEFKKARIYDDGYYMELTVQLKRVGGKLEGVSNLAWSNTTAEWDEIDGAKSYDVKLLRDDKTVTTVSTTGTTYNFAGYLNKEGEYTFRVRGISSYNSKTGEWSGDSDSISIDEDEANSYTGTGRWMQDGTGLWYAYDTGGYPANGWKQIDGAWYYFNRSGYVQTGWLKIDGYSYYLGAGGAMTTGWQYISGRWYYMNQRGEMQTGWQFVNNCWYYMNSSGAMETGWLEQNGQWYYLNSSGAMTTGWQQVNGKLYYMGENGVMYANTWTPDGRYVDVSGALVQ